MKIDDRLKSFFQKHNLYKEDMFNYFEKNSTMLDSNYSEQKA